MAVIESKGNGFSLFNGVKLTSLPEYNTDVYTNAVVLIAGSSYTFVVSTLPFKHNGTNLFVGAQHFRCIFRKTADDKFWTTIQIDQEQTSGNMNKQLVPIWSNYDVVSTTDNSVYFAASEEPISLDGMNVIEWDGDTTGLETSPTSSTHYYISNAVDIDVAKTATYVAVRGGIAKITSASIPFEEMGGYYNAGGNVHFVSTASEAYPTTGVYVRSNAIQYIALFAYYPIAEPEQPEEPEGHIGAGVKFLIRQIFNDAFAEVLISQMRE